MKFSEFIIHAQKRVESGLDRSLPQANTEPVNLYGAMRYSTMSGGKRIRPLLCYGTALAIEGDLADCDPVAVAVEIMHCYSLIHDDLPAMDNSDLRRGEPSCHKAFDEATAILAGDALQTLAFETIIKYDNPKLPAEKKLRLLDVLATTVGTTGMAGGQGLDLLWESKEISLEQLQEIHERKTGALIRASIIMAAISCGKDSPEIITALDSYAKHIGLVFQIIDDILDIEQSTESLGKPQGQDSKNKKTTYPSLLGLEKAKHLAQNHFDQAIAALETFGDKAMILKLLAEYIFKRSC